jgi:CHAT domain-containing protein
MAEIKALEAESAARLASEGEVLYDNDTTKRNGREYCSLAVGLIERGELRLGIREASKALFLGQSHRDACLVALAKRDLSLAYSFAGQLDRAQQYAEEALSGSIQCRDTAVSVARVAHRVLGDVLLRRGRPREALREYESIRTLDPNPALLTLSMANAYLAAGETKRASDLFRSVKSQNTTIEALAQRGLGQVALTEGRPEEAVKLFEQAAKDSRGDDDAYQRLWAFAWLGRARAISRDTTGARDAYGRAILTAENVRSRFRSEELKAGFFGDVQEIFDEAIAVFAESGNAEQALELSERSRGRALQDLIRGRVQAKLRSEVLTDGVATNVSLTEIRSAIPDNVTLIVYHSLAKRTYAWTVRRSGVAVKALELERVALSADVRSFREAIRQRTPETTVLSRRLYDHLIRPLELPSGEDVVIVPHGALHYLPFQALSGGAGFFIEERGISYLPAASVMKHFARAHETKRQRVLALGNPDLGSAGLSLPGAEREVAHLRTVFPEAEVYVGAAATKQQLVRRAPSSDVVHVAAHAELDEIDPLYSVIHLAPVARQSGDLEAHEVYELDLSGVSLVALSGCNTGVGRVSRGDELWGFTRSFLAAGSRTLLVSLWQVEDEATALLMARFYGELGAGNLRSALRAAQLQLLRDARTRDPFFWAGFDAIGDWR